MKTIVVLVIVLFVALFAIGPILGTGGFGPENTVQATVTRCYVDVSGSGDHSESHYMVSTDKGIFEVNNGIFLGVWNADELYGSLIPGKTYIFTTKGRKVVNFFFQEYPYIIAAREVSQIERN